MLPPLRFKPILKARAWGAQRLIRYGKPTPAGKRIGESWELADLPDSILDGVSVVEGGALAGHTLRELRRTHRDALLGIATAAPDGGFPLLVKFLDAADNLSLQVHPDAAYVRAHPDAHLKTEAWVIVECVPGARVYRGIRESVDADAFERALDEGRAIDLIESIEVAPGDCVWLPSGICHALGAGILAVEFQTPSDTTFRVWDWDRHDPARPLHRAEARACMRMGTAQRDSRPAVVRADPAQWIAAGGLRTRELCRNRFFRIEWSESADGAEIPLSASGIPEVWVTLRGALGWRTRSGSLRAEQGATVLRPAEVEPGSVEAAPGTIFLRGFCASPLDRALA